MADYWEQKAKDNPDAGPPSDAPTPEDVEDARLAILDALTAGDPVAWGRMVLEEHRREIERLTREQTNG